MSFALFLTCQRADSAFRGYEAGRKSCAGLVSNLLFAAVAKMSLPRCLRGQSGGILDQKGLQEPHTLLHVRCADCVEPCFRYSGIRNQLPFGPAGRGHSGLPSRQRDNKVILYYSGVILCYSGWAGNRFVFLSPRSRPLDLNFRRTPALETQRETEKPGFDTNMAVPDLDIGSRCEFRTYHKILRKEGGKAVKLVTDPFKSEKKDADSTYALVIKRDYSNKEGHGSVTLKINSPHLLQAFRQVIKSYPSVSSDFNSPFELSSPFQMLMHWWDELDIYRRETEDANVRMHLNLLFEFMEFEIGPDREKVMATVGEGRITYFNAWILFRPGDLMYTKVLDRPWLLRCEKSVYEESTQKGPYLEVHGTYTDHDGTHIGEAKHKVVLYQKKLFGQENPALIVDLPIYPRKFVKDEVDLEERLIERGQKFLAHKAVSVEEYDGIAHYLKEPPYSFWHPDMAEFDGVWLPYTVRLPRSSPPMHPLSD